MRSVVLSLVILTLLFFVVVLWMADGHQRPGPSWPEPVQLNDVKAASRGPEDPSLTVVTWNIAWAYGWGSDGLGPPRPKDHFDRTLEEMGRVLKKLDPDIVLLQEVDFDSTRSHRVDQALYLARAVELPYVAKALSWKANWVPYPPWPPDYHFGHMQSGGVILSRFPISNHRVETVSKPKSFSWWYNLFNIFRYHQQATLQTDLGPVLVMNVHAEAYERESRTRHARLIAERLSSELIPYSVVGGDFNTVLPEARVRKGYPDEEETSHVDDPTLELIRGVSGLVDTVSGETYANNEAAWFTFPSHEPNRKLDYLLHGAGFRVEEVHVPSSLAGELSDHFPLVARLAPVGSPPSRPRLTTTSSTTAG